MRRVAGFLFALTFLAPRLVVASPLETDAEPPDLCPLSSVLDADSRAPETQARGTIRGTVLDRADGAPIEDVSVRVQDAGQSVKTDASGRFELLNIEPGRRTIYVSIVGFILVKRPVVVAAGETIDVVIALSEGTGTYSEEVTVTGERFREQEKAVPAQQTLGSADIQNLRNLLTNDPMRAIQVLPGVTTGDDFHSEFAVRGSGFKRMTSPSTASRHRSCCTPCSRSRMEGRSRW